MSFSASSRLAKRPHCFEEGGDRPDFRPGVSGSDQGVEYLLCFQAHLAVARIVDVSLVSSITYWDILNLKLLRRLFSITFRLRTYKR